MEKVKFHFDPLCPWCYQTSRWVRRLEELGELDVDWGVFSLEVVNIAEGTDPSSIGDTANAAPALRTAIAIRDSAGSKAIGKFYAALGARVWEQEIPEQDKIKAVRESLEEAGLDPALCDKALSDPSTWESVLEEHNALIERTRSFGVPTIVLDGGEGNAVFGPVISVLPSDEDAVPLWRSVAWLARYDNFSELKRDRVSPPDLPAWEFVRDQRRAERAKN